MVDTEPNIYSQWRKEIETHKDLAPVATGGRYDALTERMGQGKRIPAVGAVLRPDLTLLLRGNKHD